MQLLNALNMTRLYLVFQVNQILTLEKCLYFVNQYFLFVPSSCQVRKLLLIELLRVVVAGDSIVCKVVAVVVVFFSEKYKRSQILKKWTILVTF